MLYLYIAAAVTVSVWLFVLSPLLEDLIVQPNSSSRAKYYNRWEANNIATDGRKATLLADKGVASPPSNSPYAGAAIVTLSGGDTSGRNCVALVQSLRDVGTVLPIVVLLARGGLGSAACQNRTWKEENNRPDVRCGSEHTIGKLASDYVRLIEFSV